MKRLGIYISIIFSICFTQKIQAQNIDNDGMYILVTADTIVECQDDVKVKVETCHLSQLSIGIDIINIIFINPFEVEIDLSYCRIGAVTPSCHDTILVFPSLPNGNYKFTIKSSVEDCLGGGFFAEDDDSVSVVVNHSNTTFNPFVNVEKLCGDNGLINFLNLDAGAGFNDYTWNDGSKNSYLTVGIEGEYVVTVKDNEGCVYTDSVMVLNNCTTSIYVPNSFTPDGDGINDKFRAYGKEIDFDKMQIFNRWGELIFETNDLNNGWDGHKSPLGGYVYKIYYYDSDNIYKILKGGVSLIR